MKRIFYILSAILSLTTSISAGAAEGFRSAPKHAPIVGEPLQTLGSPKVLIVLAEFSDTKFTLPDPKGYYTNAFNGTGFSDYGATGSVREWLEANSKGRFVPEFEIVGPVTLSGTSRYYGRNDSYGSDVGGEALAEEACRLAASQTDFSRFDNDGDGYVDFIYIYYAGGGESGSGKPETVRPASGSLISQGLWAQGNGVIADRYAYANEWADDSPEGIGVFLYQYLQMLGLPSLSEPASKSYTATPGSWDMMDRGYLNNGARTPANLSGVERAELGWLTPRVLTSPTEVTLTDLARSNEAVKIPAGRDGAEYFLAEYRSREGWDEYLPNHGLLIWHVIYDPELWATGIVNGEGSRSGVSLVKPNNFEFASTADPAAEEETLAGWCFPGTSGATELSDTSTPSMRNSNGEATSFPLSEITEDPENGSVSFIAGDAMLARIPVALAPTGENVGEDWFEASWNPVDGVTEYQVTVYAGHEKKAGEDRCDFGSGARITLPSGWTVSNAVAYTSAVYVGEEPPSLRMKDEGATLTTPVYNSAIRGFSFWGRQVNAGASTMMISGQDSDERWHMITELNLTTEGETYSFDEETIPGDTRCLRIVFHRISGSLALDDITVNYGEDPVVCPGYDGVRVKGATSLRVDRLPDDENYYYFTVRAVHDGHLSEESTPIAVVLGRASIAYPENGGTLRIENLSVVSDNMSEVYTIDGLLIGRGTEVALPSPGLYIVRTYTGSGAVRTEKVAVGVK